MVYAMDSRELLEKLGKFHEFKDLVVRGIERGYLERSEALRLLELVRSIVEDVSGGRAKVTLSLIDTLKEMIRNPGFLAKYLAEQGFGREDAIPMPRYLAELLPKRPLLPPPPPLPGLNLQFLEKLMSISLKDLVSELDYILEALLEQVSEYAKLVERYILTHGVGGAQLDGTKLSALAEVVGRAWLSTVVGGPWKSVEPAIRQVKRYQYEFDAVATEIKEGWVRVYVAEIEVYSHRFLERIEGKVRRLRELLRDYRNAYTKLGYGARGVCLAEFITICFNSSGHAVML